MNCLFVNRFISDRNLYVFPEEQFFMYIWEILNVVNYENMSYITGTR